MSIEIVQIPVWTDNYIYIIHENQSQKTAVIDPAEDININQVLKEKNWKLNFIFNTHHHLDHTGGNKKLKAQWNCEIYGYQNDAHRIPEIDHTLKKGDVVSLGTVPFKVLFLPGHTLGHIAYWSETEQILFCGDCLFAMGCGRLFEGTPQQMFSSLSEIKKLHPDTQIYCAHEYSLKNAQFALTVHPNNSAIKQRYRKIQKLRQTNKPTIPFSLKEDLLTNPFLMAKTVTDFAHIRSLRDQF